MRLLLGLQLVLLLEAVAELSARGDSFIYTRRFGQLLISSGCIIF